MFVGNDKGQVNNVNKYEAHHADDHHHGCHDHHHTCHDPHQHRHDRHHGCHDRHQHDHDHVCFSICPLSKANQLFDNISSSSSSLSSLLKS